MLNAGKTAVAKAATKEQERPPSQSGHSKIGSFLRKTASLASAGALVICLAQTTAKAQSVIDTNKLTVHGFALNTDALGSVDTMGTVAESFLNLGNNRTLTAVAGEYNLGSTTTSGDIGLKYEDGKNLFRGTERYDRDASGRLGQSFGFDTETYLTKTFTFLGDVSDVTMGKPEHVDFGAGPQVKYGNNSLFAIYSDRNYVSSYRAGYMYDTRDHFFSLLADYRPGTDPVVSGYYSTPYTRFMASYDPNAENLFFGTILTFGNNKMNQYVTEGFLKEQLILTTKNRSLPDSDYSYIFPSSFFLDPKGEFSDVLRVNVSDSLRTGTISGGFVDNAVMMRTSRKGGGIIFTQFAYKNTDITGIQPNSSYYGVGFGYKTGGLPNLYAVLNLHSKGVRLDFNLNF